MKQHRTFIILIVIWLIINLITSVSVELYDDEAYYWMYTQFMDWGYFDHPPGVAVMIWLGSFLGKTELAVRLFNVLFTGISITLIYWLVKPKNVLVFCTSVFSFLVLHLIGFVALPDTPFFLSAILFLLSYRYFLKDDSLRNQLLLSIAAALMIYCKYHSFVVIMFTVLSNVKLFINYRMYVVALLTLVFISPHIYWQFANDFPSISYHLADRAAPEYKVSQTLDYLGGNLPFLGGLVSVVLFVAAGFYKPVDKWEKALKWNLFGMYIFFFLITFKGQYIEANWTLFCVFPLLYLGYKQVESSRYFDAYKYLTFFFAAILVVIRFHIVSPLAIIKKDRVWDFYDGRQFAQMVKEIAGERKITANRYQDASVLNFYLDEGYYITSLNIDARANQYSIWKIDTALCNQKVAFVNFKFEGTEIKARKFLTAKVALLDSIATPNCRNAKE